MGPNNCLYQRDTEDQSMAQQVKPPPAMPLPLQLPANGSGKPMEEDQIHGTLAPTWETHGAPDPMEPQDQTQVLWPCGE